MKSVPLIIGRMALRTKNEKKRKKNTNFRIANSGAMNFRDTIKVTEPSTNPYIEWTYRFMMELVISGRYTPLNTMHSIIRKTTGTMGASMSTMGKPRLT